MKEIGVEHYFHNQEYVENDLLESLLLNLVYNREKREFYLVLVVGRTPDFYKFLETGEISKNKSRQFCHLVFTDVSDVSMQGRTFSSNANVIYSIGKKGGGMLQDHTVKQQQIREITLKFDSDHQCHFTFDKILFEQKWGRGVKREDEEEWDYFDVETGEKFDFYNPSNL